jgi:hypothetical protein
MVQCNPGCPTPGDCDRLCSACHQVYSWQPPGQAFAVMRMKKKKNSGENMDRKLVGATTGAVSPFLVVVSKLGIT